jgi:hypothetical protein
MGDEEESVIRGFHFILLAFVFFISTGLRPNRLPGATHSSTALKVAVRMALEKAKCDGT